VTVRDIYHSTCVTAEQTRQPANASAQQVYQASIASAVATYLSNTPDNRAGAAYVTYNNAVQAANQTLAASRPANEQCRG